LEQIRAISASRARPGYFTIPTRAEFRKHHEPGVGCARTNAAGPLDLNSKQWTICKFTGQRSFELAAVLVPTRWRKSKAWLAGSATLWQPDFLESAFHNEFWKQLSKLGSIQSRCAFDIVVGQPDFF
jgi:hypothetical protein